MSNTAATAVLKVTDQSFADAVKTNKLLVVDCYADWCGPCRMIAPLVEDLANEYSGRVSFAKVDVDQAPNVSRQYHVSSIPTLLFFKNGEMVDRQVGALPKHALQSRVESLLSN
ncbi:MAG: thioredoxin [bacterium]|nr:thioredoxin [bacterium]